MIRNYKFDPKFGQESPNRFMDIYKEGSILKYYYLSILKPYYGRNMGINRRTAHANTIYLSVYLFWPIICLIFIKQLSNEHRKAKIDDNKLVFMSIIIWHK